MPLYLALKEIWYNKGRFLLIASIVALITTLILFIAALAEGLGNGNREYISKLDGELLVYQKNVDLAISARSLPLSYPPASSTIGSENDSKAQIADSGVVASESL